MSSRRFESGVGVLDTNEQTGRFCAYLTVKNEIINKSRNKVRTRFVLVTNRIRRNQKYIFVISSTPVVYTKR